MVPFVKTERLKRVWGREMVEMLIQDMAVGQCLNNEQIFETKMPWTTINSRTLLTDSRRHYSKVLSKLATIHNTNIPLVRPRISLSKILTRLICAAPNSQSCSRTACLCKINAGTTHSLFSFSSPFQLYSPTTCSHKRQFNSPTCSRFSNSGSIQSTG